MNESKLMPARTTPQISNRQYALVVACVLLAVGGCAGGKAAYRDGTELLAKGEVDSGLARLKEAVALDPKSVEYRITLATKSAQVIREALIRAELARRDGRIADAEADYRWVLTREPANVMAKQGLEALLAERRHRRLIALAETEFARGETADIDSIAEQLRQVLNENPSQREAKNLQARVDDVRAKREAPDAVLSAAFKKPITLEFRDASLKSVFDAIAKVSGLNFFFDKDIRPDLKATVLAKNTSIEDAIRLVLITNQLEQKVLSQNSVLIYPNNAQKLKDYQSMSVRTFYLANADVKAIANTIKTILKTQDLVTDERLGIIIMRDTPEVVRLAEKLIALQDLADPEVMLDVEVLEVKRSRLQELGVSWPDQVALTPLSTNGRALTLDELLHLNQQTTQVTIGSATIIARDQEGDADILANPRIRVRNKDTARILIGDRVPVITTTSTATGFVSDSVTYVDVGLKLEAEPHIYLDDEVSIKIHLEVSNLVKEVTSKAGTLAYQIGTRTADTVLRLKNGETQVLAGLIGDEDRSSANKVPGFGSIPGLGRLFGSTRDEHQRSEIVLSITPHVVRSLRRPEMVAAEFESGTQTSVGARSLTFSTVQPEAKKGVEGAGSPTPANGSSAANPSEAAKSQATNEKPVATSDAVTSAAVPVAVAGNPSSDAVVNSKDAPSEKETSPPILKWQLPAEAKAGEQFTAVLSITSDSALRGLPLLIAYDPQVLQVVRTEEGEFLKQGAAPTNFSSRVDPIQGKIFIAAVRQNTSGYDAGVTGAGTMVSITFKAIKSSGNAQVQLLSASPEPQSRSPIQLPITGVIKITQQP